MRILLLATMCTAVFPLDIFGQSLVGVWTPVEDVDTRGPDAGHHTSDVQPGLLIFTPKHYSEMHIRGFTSRPPLSDNPTDEERLRTYQLVVAHSGIYIWNDSTITFKPMVAQSPAMMAGITRTVQVRLQQDSLWFTIRAADGGLEGTVKWVRIERSQ
jgi:hypothetical protein